MQRKAMTQVSAHYLRYSILGRKAACAQATYGIALANVVGFHRGYGAVFGGIGFLTGAFHQ